VLKTSLLPYQAMNPILKKQARQEEEEEEEEEVQASDRSSISILILSYYQSVL
jgi:hypothetical protein